MSSKEIIQLLVDVVSKNGNLLLNVVQTPAGDIEQDVLNILEEMASWMEINGNAIWGTRPWKVYGEGPSMQIEMEPAKFNKGKAVAIAVAFQWIFNYIVSSTFPALYDFSPMFAYSLYGIICVAAAIFVWRWVPETKGKTLEDMSKLWKKNK